MNTVWFIKTLMLWTICWNRTLVFYVCFIKQRSILR